MPEQDPLYLTAKQAATELNVALPTIYAYVSRGLLRSVPAEDSRRHLYLADEVRSLRKRRTRLGKDGGHKDDDVPGLSWGSPVLDTEISLIADERLYYRGVDACKLADTATLEATATLLWACYDLDPFSPQQGMILPDAVMPTLHAPSLDPMTRTLAALPHIADADLNKYNMTDHGRWQLGARLLRAVASLIAGKRLENQPLHVFIADAWSISHPAAPDLLRRALVLCAEHELNVSSFTVRCAVSSGATLYHSIIAGLCALTGPKHGGVTFGMNALLDELDQTDDPLVLVKRRLQSGEAFRGFTHRLYPNGDPRARHLIETINGAFNNDPFVAKVNELLALVESAAGSYPTIDFALSLIGRLFALPEHAGISMFALGRTAGWIAHALEQEKTGTLIRPRARYIGQPIKEKL